MDAGVSDFLKAVPSVTGWASLVAFVAVLIAWVVRAKVDRVKQALDTEPDPRLVSTILDQVGQVGELREEDRAKIAKEILEHRLLRLKLLLKYGLLAGVLLAIIAIVAILTQTPHPAANTSDRTMVESRLNETRLAILGEKGNYEAFLNYHLHSQGEPFEKTAALNVFDRSSQLGEQMLAYDDREIRISEQVIKFEYAMLAFYMAATAAPEASQSQLLSKRAIACGDEALKRLKTIDADASRGDSVAKIRQDWMSNDRTPDRTKYYRAIAMAINAKNGGEKSPRDVKEALDQISKNYLAENPPEKCNPFLTWALMGKDPLPSPK